MTRRGLQATMRVATASEPNVKPLETRGSAVTANHHLAAYAGAEILAAGGNAMDAAAATSLAAGVVEPAMSGLGGRGYLIVLPPGEGEPRVIDGHERAPLKTSAEMFDVLDEEEHVISGWGPQVHVAHDANSEGHRAAAVPSLLRALSRAHETYGRLPWARVVEPAIALASDGFAIDRTLAGLLAKHHRKLARFAATAEIFLDDGHPRREGELLVQSDLAASLRAISEHGPDELYAGSLALAVVREMEDGGGVISLEDLGRIEASLDRPLTSTYRGHRLFGLRGPTGAVTLFEIMNLLEGSDPTSLAPSEPEHLNVLLQAFRLAFHDRSVYFSDRTDTGTPGDVEGLADKAFASRRRTDLELTASGVPRRTDDGRSAEERHTTHLCAVDDDRMVVSMTQSVIDAFGCGVTVRGTGILLNSAMHNFDPRPGRRASVGPWRRAPHYGCPLIVADPTGAVTALGGAGGTKIVTGLAQVLSRLIDFDQSVHTAISAPRIHTDGPAAELDSRFAESTSAELRRRGHTVERLCSERGTAAFARINGVKVGRDDLMSSGFDVFEEAGAAVVDS